jgi:hypothetical protein
MSKVALSGNASGTGTFTIASPNSNTDRTLTLPDAAGTLTTSEAVTAAGYTTSAAVLTQFNATGSAPVYACRAWVNFDGTGTVAIRASGNVSSITDNGSGNYNINFSTGMQDVNYVVTGSVGPADNMRAAFVVGPTNNFGPTTPPENNSKFTNTFQITTGIPGSSSGTDWAGIYVAVFR